MKNCDHCGAEIPNRPRKRFCSAACRRAWLRAQPGYAESQRDYARRYYRDHADAILANQRRHKDSASEDKREADRIRRSRARSTPEARAKDAARVRRKKQAQREEGIGFQMLAVMAATSTPAKPCDSCGSPIVGRKPGAKYCSRACQRHGVHQREGLRREKKMADCAVCGKRFEKRTATITCSAECRRIRKHYTTMRSRHGS